MTLACICFAMAELEGELADARAEAGGDPRAVALALSLAMLEAAADAPRERRA